MADKTEETEAEVDEGFEHRLTWKEGDLKVYLPDGTEVDPSTYKSEDDGGLGAFPESGDEPETEEVDEELGGGAPTVHLYLRPEDVE